MHEAEGLLHRKLKMLLVHGALCVRHVQAYNIPGETGAAIALDMSTLLSILNGAIVTWNHTAIAALNNRTLPGRAIVPMWCSSNSSVALLSAALDRHATLLGVANTQWPWRRAGAFPPGASDPSEFLAALAAQSTPYSLLLMRWDVALTASQTQMARLFNGAAYVAISASDLSVAVSKAEVATAGDHFVVQAAHARGGWPLAVLSYYVAATASTGQPGFCDAARRDVAFLSWALSTVGLAARAERVGWAMLPLDVAERSRVMLSGSTCDSAAIGSTALPVSGTGSTFVAKASGMR